MSSTKVAGGLLASFLMLCVSALSWGIQPHDKDDKPLPDYDAAGGIRLGLRPGASPSAAQESALLALEGAVGVELRVTYNGLTGSPRTLGAKRPLSSASSASPEVVATQFLRDNKAIWGYTDQNLDGLKLDTSYTDRHNGVTHVYFKQTDRGIPLFFGVVSVDLNAKGQVLGVQGDVFPGSQAVAPARLLAEEAAELGAEHIGVDYKAVRAAVHPDGVLLDKGSLLSPVKVTHSIYALLGAPRLTYRMVLEKSGLEWYDILVDSVTGEILHRRNLYQFAGQLTPSAPLDPNDSANPRGLLYVEHPLATVRGTGDLFRRYSYTVDPTGRPRGFANAPVEGAQSFPVNAHGPNPVNATIDQTVMPMPDAARPHRSTGLPLSSSPQSPQGWFIPQAGSIQSIGNNVDTKEDHAADNEGSTGQRADGGATGNFTGSQFVYQNSYGANNDKLPDVPAAVLTLFYVNNWYHDILYHLGFTEAAGNFQKDNFGRGGLGNDFVFADAQDGSGTNNANFGTPPDGANPRMQMFLWTGPNRDGTLDFDIIVHEYSHGLSNRLVGGPSNVDCLGLVGLTGEGGGMGEGWGDWYATILADEPAVAEYAVGDADGLRTNPVGNAPTDYTYGNLCTGPPSNPNPLGCEVHGAGEFWTIVLWELRESMINRFHNRAFPGLPFPTFTTPPVGGLPPEGNIRSAAGRTTDGSGVPARLDHGTIENAAFAAMFRVTDAMKLSVCNPTMVTMRDSILQADRNMGGEFQDLIWRVFANRGLGLLAQSTNSEVPDPVADFTVPLTVMDCEAAGGPLGAPVFAATSTSPNSVTINITDNGATEYIISRGVQGPGTPVDPTPFVEVARISGTSFTDSGVDGGVTYTYRVRASRNDDCISGSNAVDVVPLGGPLPCLVDPTFFGVSRVIDPGDCERILLDWSAGFSNCAAAGPNIKYNIYRGTSVTFTPDASNRIATGVVGNSFVDTPGLLDTLFYYVVRAEDSTTLGGGPANGGNEDNNLARVPGVVTSGTLINQGFTDDVESGPDNQSSLHFTSSGMVASGIPQRGGWFRDSSPAPAIAHSPSTVWHAFDPDNQSYSLLTSDSITVTPSSILSFFHTFATEATFDGGVVEYALVTAGVPGVFQDMGNLIYENGYNGTLLPADAPNSNVLAGRRVFMGGSAGVMGRTRAFLGALVPTGQTSQQIQIRFVFASDVAQGGGTTPQGQFLPGWYIDDITLDEPCCPVSLPPTGLVATASGDSQVTLTWQAPAGATIAEYQVFRELVSGTIPTVFDEQIATVPGNQTSYLDAQVAPDVTYAYVVRAVPTSGCPSGDSNIVTVTPFGLCRLAPEFGGLGALQALPQAICAFTLSWDAAVASCPGATVKYNVYRSTNPTFVPSLANAVAVGLTGLSFLDQTGLEDGTTYYYVVRAEDSTTNGSGPANGGNEDANLLRFGSSPRGPLSPGPDFIDDLEPAANPGYTFQTAANNGSTPTWALTPDPQAHSATNTFFSATSLDTKDDRLISPPMSLSSGAQITFWHKFFLEEGWDGGILQVSMDAGSTWLDVDPNDFVAGGYNGASQGGPIGGKRAWTGMNPSYPDMDEVVLNLGDFTGVDVLMRWRLGTDSLFPGAGSGWWIDDIQVTGLFQAGVCSSGGPCVADPVFAGLRSITSPVQATCTIHLSWLAAIPQCPGASVRYNIYRSTNPGFVPGPSNAIALGVTGLTYTDAGMNGGVTYHYVVRAEDSTTGGLGPANGGNEDDNLTRLSILPQGPIAVGPDFVDDIEPTPAPGYSTFTTRDPGWVVQSDTFAHSPSQDWFVQDGPDTSLNAVPKDAMLTLPALNLTATSLMTFYHNYDFAQFPGAGPTTRYQSGGIIEMSSSGALWTDLGPYITTGGYNGTVGTNSMSPLVGQMAWVGSSDAVPGSRIDAMQQVVVDLGAAISDPNSFNTPILDGALVRFRMGGTFQVLLDGVQGTGWAVDDIVVSDVRTPGNCGPVCTNQPVFTGVGLVSAPASESCGLAVTWSPGVAGCPGSSLTYNIYRSTDPGFTPSPANAVALGVGGTQYVDYIDLVFGETYYYIVRAEDSTSSGGGPANGGNEDDNLIRLSGSPQGVLAPGPDFADDVEPAAQPGYTMSSTRTVGNWAVTQDTTAHSADQAWVSLDDQPGVPNNTQKDDRLVLPALNLTSSSVMTFWHNFDFARFPASAPETAFQSGAVLEISANGTTWFDLGPHITAGGYNGVVDGGTTPAQSPLAGRSAWVGSSDVGPTGGANNPVAGRTDAMRQVSVNLGAAIQARFSTTQLLGALVRFRLGGTFQILIGGVQGSGWGVDDIQVTGLLAPGACVTVQPSGLVDDLRVVHAAGGQITIFWDASCASGDFDYEIYEGSLGTLTGQFAYNHESRFCSTGGDTTRTFTPGADSRYYLVVPRNGVNEGSYGQASSGAERPAAATSCLTQRTGACN